VELVKSLKVVLDYWSMCFIDLPLHILQIRVTEQDGNLLMEMDRIESTLDLTVTYR